MPLSYSFSRLRAGVDFGQSASGTLKCRRCVEDGRAIQHDALKHRVVHVLRRAAIRKARQAFDVTSG
jgi:hypothetical protein